MRLTLTLLKQSHRYRLRILWQNKGFIKEPRKNIPVFLKDQGIKPIAATELLADPPLPKWEPPESFDPRFKEPERHKDYQEIPIQEFNYSVQLMHGLDQACVLSKTQPFEGLPQSVTDHTGVASLPSQDELVQRVIMQAHTWDPTKVKLPKRSDPELPGWHFKAETGIPSSQIRSLMIGNLTRLCEMIGSQHQDLRHSRQVAHQHYFCAHYNFQGNTHTSIKTIHDSHVASNKPLAPFATEDQVDATVSHMLPDLFPVLPTIGLQEQHVWRDENITGWKDGASHIYPQLTWLSFNNDWSTTQRNAVSLLMCFGHCIALAKQLYGPDVTTLPQPISTQCIQTNGELFNFVCFQLNTLQLDNENGIKNMAWFDSDNYLFKKILPKRAMLRNTKYEDYDPEVFKKIVAMYVNGGQLGGS